MDSSHIWTVNGLPAIDPGPLFDDCDRLGLDVDFFGKANSLSITAGRDPDSAYLLLPRSTAEALAVDQLHTIAVSWKTTGTKTVSYGGWSLWRAEVVGIDGDGQAPYLCEFRDRRALLRYSELVNENFNVTLGWISSAKLYLTSTTNAGTAWTWSGLLGELWGYLPAAAGSVPTLPWSPTAKPENWQFSGVPAWDAVCQFLEACQCVPVPTSTGFRIVALGDTDTVTAGLRSRLSAYLVESKKPLFSREIDLLPETVRVLFPVRSGEPEDTDYDAREVATALTGAKADFVVSVWSDLLAEPGGSSSTPDNDSNLATAKTEIATRVKNRWTTTAINERYAGAWLDVGASPTVAFYPSTGIHRITVADYGDRMGLTTTVETLAELIRPGQVGRQPTFPRERPWLTPTDCVCLKNNSGGSLVPGRVLEVGTELLSAPTRAGMLFNGETPAPDGADNIAVTLRRMAASDIEWCVIKGLVKCRLNVNHVQHAYADVDSSSTLLQSKWHGRARIIWKDTTSTGEQDAVVLLGEMFRGPIKGVASSGLTRGGNASIAVQWGGAAASPSATVTVYWNWMDGGTVDVPTNGELLFAWFPDEQKYCLVEGECAH